MAPGESRLGPGFQHKILKRVCTENKSLAALSILAGSCGALGRLSAGKENDASATPLTVTWQQRTDAWSQLVPPVQKSSRISAGHCLSDNEIGTGPKW